MSDYMDRRKKEKLNPIAAAVISVTGRPPFTPKTDPAAAADVYGGEWPWDVKKFNPACKIAITRAHYGWWVADNSVIPLRQQCNATGMAFGFYGFLLPTKIQKQIDLYCHQVEKAGGLGLLPPIADIELLRTKKPKKPPKDWKEMHPVGDEWAEQVKDYLDGQEAAFGRKSLIYASKETWDTLCEGGVPPSWTGDYWFWVSWVPYWAFVDSNKVLPRSRYPAGCTKVAMWQYWFNGRQIGLEPNDLNVVTPEYMAELGLA